MSLYRFPVAKIYNFDLYYCIKAKNQRSSTHWLNIELEVNCENTLDNALPLYMASVTKRGGWSWGPEDGVRVRWRMEHTWTGQCKARKRCQVGCRPWLLGCIISGTFELALLRSRLRFKMRIIVLRHGVMRSDCEDTRSQNSGKHGYWWVWRCGLAHHVMNRSQHYVATDFKKLIELFFFTWQSAIWQSKPASKCPYPLANPLPTVMGYDIGKGMESWTHTYICVTCDHDIVVSH